MSLNWERREMNLKAGRCLEILKKMGLTDYNDHWILVLGKRWTAYYDVHLMAFS
jgi:hypothetical protein